MSRAGNAWLKGEPVVFRLHPDMGIEDVKALIGELEQEGFPNPHCHFDEIAGGSRLYLNLIIEPDPSAPRPAA